MTKPVGSRAPELTGPAGQGCPRPALACDPEKGLHFNLNRPLASPAEPLAGPAYARPSVVRGVTRLPAVGADPGLGDTIPKL